jgi:hypothetical protein
MLQSLLARPTAFIASHAVRRYSYASAESISRLKRPTRGGQNLTDRHRRLENSLRGKEARLKQIDHLTESSTVVKHPVRRSASTFQDFVVPEEPKPPGPEGTADFCIQNNLSAYVYLSVQSAACLVAQYVSMIYT